MATAGSLLKPYCLLGLIAISIFHSTAWATLMPVSQQSSHQLFSNTELSTEAPSNGFSWPSPQITNDFVVNQDAGIQALTWWGGSLDGIDNTDQAPAFNIEFFTSDPVTGGGGTSIYETIFSADETDILETDQELPGGSDVFQYTFVLDDVIDVEAGQSYWFTISPDLSTDTTWDWFYDQFAGDTINIEDILKGIGDGSFYIPCVDQDTPCVVICIPEPSTLLLFACGSLVLVRRSRRSVNRD